MRISQSQIDKIKITNKQIEFIMNLSTSLEMDRTMMYKYLSFFLHRKVTDVYTLTKTDAQTVIDKLLALQDEDRELEDEEIETEE